MNPADVAKSLRIIASKIDSSSKPRADLVASDIKSVITSMEAAQPDGFYNLLNSSPSTSEAVAALAAAINKLNDETSDGGSNRSAVLDQIANELDAIADKYYYPELEES